MLELNGRTITELLFRVIMLAVGLILFLLALGEFERGSLRGMLFYLAGGFGTVAAANTLDLFEAVPLKETLRGRQRSRITPIGAACQFFFFVCALFWLLAWIGS